VELTVLIDKARAGVGGLRVGTTVIVEEVARRLAGAAEGVSLFTFLSPGAPNPSWWSSDRAEGFSGGNIGSA
jgi:hypothetical protein